MVRIESRSAVPGEVRIMAVDDAGQRLEAGRLTLGAKAAVEFEIDALESGNTSLGLLGLTGTGPGEGDWRLELTTDLDIEARAYARSEGFLTALHDAALVAGEVELPLFNPGGEARPRSVLRLANAGRRACDGDGGRRRRRGTCGRRGDGGAWGVGVARLHGVGAGGRIGGGAFGIAGRRHRQVAAVSGGGARDGVRDEPAAARIGVVERARGHVAGTWRRAPGVAVSVGVGRRGTPRGGAGGEPGRRSRRRSGSTRSTRRTAPTRGCDCRWAGISSEQFDSTDLEQGNSEKGLEGSTGSGEGDWWLELTSGSDIEVLSYVDTATGPLSALRGAAGVETDAGMRYEAVLLSGAAGELRLLNAGGETVAVRVSGTDDAGAPGRRGGGDACAVGVADADAGGARGRRSGAARRAGRGDRELASESGVGRRDRCAEPGARRGAGSCRTCRGGGGPRARRRARK